MKEIDFRKQLDIALAIAEETEVSKGRKDGLKTILNEKRERIKALLIKGHSRAAIADLLASNGVKASKETIRAYINGIFGDADAGENVAGKDKTDQEAVSTGNDDKAAVSTTPKQSSSMVDVPDTF